MHSITTILGYASFIPVIFILVIVHELGHYLVARACGVKVEIFSVGFGKKIYGFTDKSGTLWQIALFPLGGFVKMKGEMIQPNTQNPNTHNPNTHNNANPETNTKDSFHHQQLWRRTLVVAAGPAANYIYAIIALTLLLNISGQAQTPNYAQTGIGAVIENSPAAKAGLQQGDIITAIEHTTIKSFAELANTIHRTAQPQKILTLTINRNNQIFTAKLSPQWIQQGKHSQPRIGVRPAAPHYVALPLGESLSTAIYTSYHYSALILQTLGSIITGTGDKDELGGPVRIAKITSDFAQAGFYSLIYLTIILSINLGLINLLPIPALDGGHLFFYLIEALRGKPVSASVQGLVMRFGIGFLLVLMVLLTFNDIRQIAF